MLLYYSVPNMSLHRITFRTPDDLERLLRKDAKTFRVPLSTVINRALAEHYQLQAILAATSGGSPDTADLAARIEHQGTAVAELVAIQRALFERIVEDAPAEPTEAQRRADQRRQDRVSQLLGSAKKGTH